MPYNCGGGYEGITCPAYTGLHFINRKTGKLYLMDPKPFYRKLGNLCRVFNAGLCDFEHLLGNNSRYAVIALFEAKSAQGLLIGSD